MVCRRDVFNGVMNDLNSLMATTITGLVLNDANGINNSGQIVANGKINGLTHQFLLTPATIVPLPNAFFIFLSGLGLLFYKRSGIKRS